MKCMLDLEPFEDVVRRFRRGGLEFTMATPPRIMKLTSSAPSRQSPRTRGMQVEEHAFEEEFHLAVVYISPRTDDAPEVIIPNGAKYLIPLPPMDLRVKEEGMLLGFIPNLKFSN